MGEKRGTTSVSKEETTIGPVFLSPKFGRERSGGGRKSGSKTKQTQTLEKRTDGLQTTHTINPNQN